MVDVFMSSSTPATHAPYPSNHFLLNSPLLPSSAPPTVASAASSSSSLVSSTTAFEPSLDALVAATTAHHQAPLIRGDWTVEQDAALRQAVDHFGGRCWKQVASRIPGQNKTHVQCLQRWNKVIKPGLIKGPWSQGEDERLKSCVEEIEKNNWVAVSERVGGRTAKQCRERWLLCLNPAIRKDKWTDEEDELLLSLHTEHGNSWAFISRFFHGRTENAIKSRVKSVIKRKNAPPPKFEQMGPKPRKPNAPPLPKLASPAPLFAPVTLAWEQQVPEPKPAAVLASTSPMPKWDLPPMPVLPRMGNTQEEQHEDLFAPKSMRRASTSNMMLAFFDEQ